MNRLPIFIFLFAISAAITWSCEKGVTLGDVKIEGEDIIPFDTMLPTDAKYFFLGKFDGHFMLWEDGEVAAWAPADTTLTGGPFPENIYTNYPESFLLDTCREDSTGIIVEHQSRFLRFEFAEERLNIEFFDCIRLDSIKEVEGMLRTGSWPFADETSGTRGVRITYTDENLTKWVTRTGSGQLQDSYFRLNTFEQNIMFPDTLDTLGFFIGEGEFAGRLFREGGNKEKVVTEGKFRIRMVPTF